MSPRAKRPTPIAAVAVCAGASLLAVVLCAAALAAGATVIHFQREPLPALEAQLHSHQVHALVFHPRPAPGHVHVSMDDGRHFTVVYGAGEQARLIALARAEGVSASVATVKAKPAKTHHKLRYIAAGILIVVIVVVAAVLLVDRRRKLGEAERDAATGA
jgi:hypothetical protein